MAKLTESLEDLQVIWRFVRRPKFWIPAFLVPGFFITLWGYLEHPEWIAETTENEAQEALDSNSAISPADLALAEISAVAETGDLTGGINPVGLNNGLSNASEEEDNKKKKSGKSKSEEEESKPRKGLLEQVLEESQKSNSNSKPNPDASNPFAEAVQRFLGLGASQGTQAAENPLRFSPIISSVQPSNGTTEEDSLAQTLLNLNVPPTEETPQLPANVGTEASSTPRVVGQVPYIPGQIPYSAPGQTATQSTSPGFISPSPGAYPYYPNQRGSGGTTSTFQGTTYSRQRGSTGSVVTPQGIVESRQRGSTGSVITQQGTIYQRQRGSTGFTAPTTNNFDTTPTTQQQQFNRGSSSVQQNNRRSSSFQQTNPSTNNTQSGSSRNSAVFNNRNNTNSNNN
ncbi:hypothetical protein [Lusitaniella coriacea]|uniref:hypothetical protein n=1 Tax=Lusitaniella coriacea TaxID=1983105 RepID=UPI003CF1164B